ncbi:MAG: MFS transporter [Pelagibacterales bacterium MED-G40]|nr:MAG: MFS transporter [Pelagibacterales bacterium MED-G40]|tara:strand:- start:2124 stop:3350 length:1227 start_codon:yes stop_codon:yes gene_type:complete
MSDRFIQNKLALITLLSACGIILVSMGLRQTFGLFFSVFEEALSVSRTEFGLAIGIQMFFWGLMAPIFGLFADKYGGNKAVFLGFLVFGLGIFLLFNGPNTGIYFQLSLGVLVGTALGATAMSVPVSEVGKHFSNEKRTLATGIVTASASVGYFATPLFTKYSLIEFGWENTLLYYLFFILFGLIASIFLFPVKKSVILESTSIKKQSFIEAIKEAFSHKGYVLLVSGFFVCGFQITLVATHIPGYMQEKGLGEWSAAIILALIGFFNIIGTLGMGYLGTKYSKKILLSILYFSRAVVIALFIFLPVSMMTSIIFGIAFGMLWLSTVPPTNGIVAQIFGTQYLSSLFGIVFFSHQIGSFFGAYLGGYFYDLYGSYDYAWYISIALSLFATLVHLPIDEKPILREKVTI